ncbi:fork head domain-containing protein [Circinella umbellata]|nr:fork head domain-containing protein [Circinella umbellata]
MHNSPPSDGKHVVAIDSNDATRHITSSCHSNKNKEQQQQQQQQQQEPDNNHYNSKELPRIPVAMRHPYMITSVRQYRSDAQQLQLQQHIISESFVPVIPYSADRPARKRRRPPFSCSSLISQAISTSETGQMTLQDIYKWILNKYPSLYNEEDTGWQNTIRHNLSLNKCFKKIPKSGSNRGKGGYWTLDSKYIEDEGLNNINKKNQRRVSPNSNNNNTRPEEQTSSSITRSHTNKKSSALPSSSQQQRTSLHPSSLSLISPSSPLPSSSIIHPTIKSSTPSSPVTTELSSSSITSTSSSLSSSSSSLSSSLSLPPSINPTTHVMQIQSILN